MISSRYMIMACTTLIRGIYGARLAPRGKLRLREYALVRSLTSTALLCKKQMPPRPKVDENEIEEKFLKGSGPDMLSRSIRWPEKYRKLDEAKAATAGQIAAGDEVTSAVAGELEAGEEDEDEDEFDESDSEDEGDEETNDDEDGEEESCNTQDQGEKGISDESQPR
ncbi:hypothetical protein TWF281_005955 [Arthrobotrys megalospora]